MAFGDVITKMMDGITQTLAQLIFHKRKRKDSEYQYVANGELWELDDRVRLLVEQGELCEAEDLIFAYMKKNPESDIRPIAGYFYAELEKMPDAYLKQHNFSRREIAQGLADINTFYGVEIVMNEED